MKKTILAAALAAAFGGAACNAWAAAVTDGSMGAVQSLSGNFIVPQSLGQVRGGNLFHSFGKFSIAPNESATFFATDPAVRHVISRVTGGEASLIQGSLTLRSVIVSTTTVNNPNVTAGPPQTQTTVVDSGTRPDFWLINPAGIAVTGGASFNLPAGLHLSTAPQLRMGDGTVWATNSATPSTLSVAAPEAFGFLAGSTPAAIQWRGADVALSSGSRLDLSAGDLSIERATLSTTGGHVQLTATGAAQLLPGAFVLAGADNSSRGSIAVEAASLTITGGGSGRTGLVALTGPGSSGGGIDVRLGGALAMSSGAEITANGASSTANGSISVTAATATLSSAGGFTSINTGNFGTAPGPALTVNVAGLLDLQGGDLTTSTNSAGAAGALAVQAGSIRLDGGGALGAGGVNSFGANAAPGTVQVSTPGRLDMLNGARIWSSNSGSGTPGTVRVDAGTLAIDGQGIGTTVGSLTTGSGLSANVEVLSRTSLSLANGGQIAAATLGSGAAGTVTVSAPVLDLQGREGVVTGIFGSSLGADSGSGGSVTVDTGRLSITGPARISTSTITSNGGAGSVTVRADQALLDGQGLAAGIESFAYGAIGDAGTVQVLVRDQLELKNGAAIVAGTLGIGDPGTILVKAGSVLIDGSKALQTYTGIGGDALGSGSGAMVRVEAQRLDIREGGAISSATSSTNPAGSVEVIADSVRVDGNNNARVATGINANSAGPGDAGDVRVAAREVVITNDGSISSSTLDSGRGGRVLIEADRLTVSNAGGIFSVAGGSGDAGLIDLRVKDALALERGGFIVANTGGTGAAGLIQIQAGSFSAGGETDDGQRSRVASRALPASSGKPGSILIETTGDITLSDRALLSVANDAKLANTGDQPATLLGLSAANIRTNGAEITAAASSNGDAGAIVMLATGVIDLVNTTVRTSANEGNGGPIGMAAGGKVGARNTSVTTSVDGTQGGNGGDIAISGESLVLQSGFVQANTVAERGTGGTVTIDVKQLVPDGNNVFVGGTRIASFRPNTPGFNVIQAAAPNGLSGTLDVTRPELNLAGTLVSLSTARIDFGLLSRDQCQIGFDSSFTPLGYGALPATVADPLRISP